MRRALVLRLHDGEESGIFSSNRQLAPVGKLMIKCTYKFLPHRTAKTVSVHKQYWESKRRQLLLGHAVKWQLVCISNLKSEREVCPHLLLSVFPVTQFCKTDCTNICRVYTEVPPSLRLYMPIPHHKVHSTGCPHSKTNKKISECEAAVQKFGRRIKRRYFSYRK